MTALVSVVPHAGTWIEIERLIDVNQNYTSFPTRERGLKFEEKKNAVLDKRRSPRGNVD